MDGLRKIPDNVPNKEMLKNYLGKPLTSIPDPFEKYESFGEHNNARLKSFLDQFGFQYNFISSTNKYKSGDFDNTLKLILENHQKIISIILPTLREERKKTYSPFLPISPISGKVLQVKIDEYRPSTNSIIFKDPSNNKLYKQVMGQVACLI
jgi:lysyl-tRNA synthetase class 1